MCSAVVLQNERCVAAGAYAAANNFLYAPTPPLQRMLCCTHACIPAVPHLQTACHCTRVCVRALRPVPAVQVELVTKQPTEYNIKVLRFSAYHVRASGGWGGGAGMWCGVVRPGETGRPCRQWHKCAVLLACSILCPAPVGRTGLQAILYLPGACSRGLHPSPSPTCALCKQRKPAPAPRPRPPPPLPRPPHTHTPRRTSPPSLPPLQEDHLVTAGRDSIRMYRLKTGQLRGTSVRLAPPGKKVSERGAGRKAGLQEVFLLDPRTAEDPCSRLHWPRQHPPCDGCLVDRTPDVQVDA